MEYGLEKIPFSRYGSYFAVSINQEDGCLYLRDLHGGDETCSDIYEMRFPEGSVLSVRNLSLCGFGKDRRNAG